jgi:hypothetical protein
VNKITCSRGEVIDILSFQLPEIGDDILFNAIVVKEAENPFISTCINLRIDGYGETADEALKDMKENCGYFIKRNFELLPIGDAWRNIYDLCQVDKWAEEIWGAYYRFLEGREA